MPQPGQELEVRVALIRDLRRLVRHPSRHQRRKTGPYGGMRNPMGLMSTG